MKSLPFLALGFSLLFLGSGCQHAVLSSSDMQQKFFSSLKNSNSGEESALRCARYHTLVGRADLALNELNHAIALDPNNVRLLNAMGGCYDRLGNYAKAREMYEMALAQDNGNNLVRNNLGYSRYLSGDLAGAENIFQKILADDSKDTLACNNLGLVWCRQGKEKEALSLWQKSDGDIQAREKLHQVLTYLGKPVDQRPIGVSKVGGNFQVNPVALSDGVKKPIMARDRSPEIMQSASRPVASLPSATPATDAESAPVRTSRVNRPPAGVLPELPVKIEEVPMVVQPASYTQPPADIKISAAPPARALRSAPDQVKQLPATASDSGFDLLPEDATPPRSHGLEPWTMAQCPQTQIYYLFASSAPKKPPPHKKLSYSGIYLSAAKRLWQTGDGCLLKWSSGMQQGINAKRKVPAYVKHPIHSARSFHVVPKESDWGAAPKNNWVCKRKNNTAVVALSRAASRLFLFDHQKCQCPGFPGADQLRGSYPGEP